VATGTDHRPAAHAWRHHSPWYYIGQVGIGAFVAAFIIFIGLGIAELAGANPDESWLLEAVSLLGLGVLILIMATVRRHLASSRRGGPRHSRPRPEPPPAPLPEPTPATATGTATAAPATSTTATTAARPAAATAVADTAAVAASAAAASDSGGAPASRSAEPVEVTWQCTADVSTPGVVLFVLAPSGVAHGTGHRAANKAELPSSGDLGPVACYVADPQGFGQRANDECISRARGVLTTRWHPSFFPGAPEPESGEYRFRWDELRDDDWHLLSSGSLKVDYQPPAAEESTDAASDKSAE
jgi:hypothetical protein